MEGVWGVRSPSGGVGIEKEPRTGVWRSKAKWPSWQPWVGLSLLLRDHKSRPGKSAPAPPIALNLQNADHRAKEKTHSFCCQTAALHQRRFQDKPERMGQGTPSNSPPGTLPLWKDWHQDSMVTSSTLRIKSKALFTAVQCCTSDPCPSLILYHLSLIHCTPNAMDLNVLCSFPPQGLCTGFSLCWEHCLPHSFRRFLFKPDFLRLAFLTTPRPSLFHVLRPATDYLCGYVFACLPTTLESPA